MYLTWDKFIGDQEKLRDNEKIFPLHRETIERNINVAKELKELEEKLGSFGMSLATEKQLRERDRAKIFYFVHIEGRDAEIVRMRDSQYDGNTDKMLVTYRESQHDAEDIKRLEYIKAIDRYLRSTGFSLFGHHVSSITNLVNEFEQERKNGLHLERQQPLKSTF